MKKHNKLQFFKTKNFYIVLSVAVIAVAAVTIVGVKMVPRNPKKQNLADLNPTEIAQENVEEIENDATNSLDVALDQENLDQSAEAKQYTNDEMLEFDVGSFVDEEQEQVADATNQEEVTEKTTETKTVDEVQEPEEAVSVMQPSANNTKLSFNQDSTIEWPVKGNVIRAFNMNQLVHYVTLNEWKTSPAIIISSEVGTDVIAGVSGVVTKIDKIAETGTTVTMDIGDGYQIVYGQLDQVTCDVGQTVNAGTVFAKVANPTKYYSIEGSNLYLQMLSNDAPVNPMLFLSGEE